MTTKSNPTRLDLEARKVTVRIIATVSGYLGIVAGFLLALILTLWGGGIGPVTIIAFVLGGGAVGFALGNLVGHAHSRRGKSSRRKPVQ